MPRPRRRIVPDLPVHVVQRGNNRSRTFLQPRDYRSYLAALSESAEKYAANVHAYVLMPNHVHLLVTGHEADTISKLMQQLGRKYVSYFNRTHGHTGTLWEGRFRSSLIDSDHYLFACYRYIELNPVRAGIVDLPRTYRWSSYRHNAIARECGWITPRPEWLALGEDESDCRRRYRRLFAGSTHCDDDRVIRQAVRKGKPLRSR